MLMFFQHHSLPMLPCELWTQPLVAEFLVDLYLHVPIPVRLVIEGLVAQALHYSCVHPSGPVFEGTVRHVKCVESTPLDEKHLDIFILKPLNPIHAGILKTHSGRGGGAESASPLNSAPLYLN